MEPLIQLRQLGAQFDRDDICKLINKISQEYVEIIFSSIFNHFLSKYKQSGQHDDELMNIIEITSQILISKQNNQEAEEDDDKTSKVLIDSMPSALIGNVRKQK